MDAEKFQIVLVTAPDLKTARKLARLALQHRLVACVNLIPRIESHYWWQRKIQRSSEVLLLFKTIAAQTVALEKLILAKHPYDTPEFVVLAVSHGNERYLNWLKASCTGSVRNTGKRN
jgi:periplasmic divalent cation tolerance protein